MKLAKPHLDVGVITSDLEGDVARISFVRDPDGGWIEISQRASLTGALGS